MKKTEERKKKRKRKGVEEKMKTKFTFPRLILIIAQVLKRKMVENHGFSSFTNNKQTYE